MQFLIIIHCNGCLIFHGVDIPEFIKLFSVIGHFTLYYYCYCYYFVNNAAIDFHKILP